MSSDHFDVLIVGGGLSGIGAACSLTAHCPHKTFAVLEGRSSIGGTWDLFRYPGIRSDSDMFTLGYSFRPWMEGKAIADGHSILKYIKDTARDHGIDPHVRHGHQVKRASWSSKDAQWTVEAECGPDKHVAHFTCQFLMVCSGYYSYVEGYTPLFPGSERFKGLLVHPQKWPQDLAFEDKRVIVIGSGATAVTLVPAMARTAAQVTMLQRSPTYVVARPEQDAIANFLRRHLPAKLAYGLVRWRNILFGIYFFNLCKRSPERVRNWILDRVKGALGPNFDVATHFSPRYNPWDQRMCLVPDGDLFESIRQGKASVVTDEIETFTENGIRLRSGKELQGDIIVTATGLNLVALGEIQISVDGRPIEPGKALNYKGTMYGGIPNLASTFGYTNASWTLKSELTCDYICRLLNHMQAKGYQVCVPQNDDPSVQLEPWLNLTSGYIQRVADKLPKQGSKAPWRLHQNYVKDLMSLKFGSLDDGVLRFLNPADSLELRSALPG
ncbi:MAG TPA: NAD(P)/FAD-dependent oxidoreductase [Steroidobacteraceae bacterium]|nr:NAD(P)/FAD-dependent oxidoreductase [Steroidobacteraceae bacterium]